MEKISIRTTIGYIFVGFLFIILITSGIICSMNDKKDIKNNLKYTIAFTSEIKHLKQTYVYYYYYYQDQKFENRDAVNSKIKVPGGRYYVEFSSKNPDNCNILEDKPVPEWIKEAPFDGWDSIPLVPD